MSVTGREGGCDKLLLFVVLKTMDYQLSIEQYCIAVFINLILTVVSHLLNDHFSEGLAITQEILQRKGEAEN